MCRIEYITLYTVIQIVLLNRSEHRVYCTHVFWYVCTCVYVFVCTYKSKYIKQMCASVHICTFVSASVLEP